MNAVFLSGGGARGAYEVGVLKALLKDGPPVQLLGGASIGAINAVLTATGQLEEVAERWMSASSFRFFPPRVDLWNLHKWPGILDNRNLARRLQTDVRWSRLPHSPIHVFIAATNLTLRSNEVFENSEITYRHVLASAAIPLLFPPVKIGKSWYIDGGFSLLRPLKPLLKAGASRIFTVFLTPRRPRREGAANILEMADRALEVILSSALAADRKQIESTNQEIVRLREKGIDLSEFRLKPYREVSVVPIYPSMELGKLGSYLFSSKQQVNKMMEMGMTDCYRVLKQQNIL